MKKGLLIICLAAALLLLGSCGEKKKEEPAATAQKAVPLTDAVRAAAADADALVPLNGDDLSADLGIEADEYSEFVFLQSTGMDGREILVIRAKDEASAGKAAKAAEEYLQRRRNEARNYAPAAYELLTAAEVKTRNKTVALIVGPNAAQETEAVLAGE